MYNENQFSLGISKPYEIKETIKMYNIIIDRKSKYSVVGGLVNSESEVKKFINELNKDDFFRKASHNSYAFRIRNENGSILEGKNDDGEKGAGMCILRELQRVEGQNIILVVTRYFGGIHLYTDRFKNIIDSCKIFIKKN
ncbi:hypothetical protein CSA08_02075 [Candidatus Gracilibacteria bacterium]|nr:MAG: hypothetical protein CSA08_02075 [Candidatus Gracilibacteria bacterium]